MVNLGYLYDNEKDIAAAEKYYQMVVERGHASAMGNLANLYYEGNNTSQRKKAYELSKKAFEVTGHLDIILMVIHIVVLLWNKKVRDASHLMTDFLKGPLNYESINQLFLQHNSKSCSLPWL